MVSLTAPWKPVSSSWCCRKACRAPCRLGTHCHVAVTSYNWYSTLNLSFCSLSYVLLLLGYSIICSPTLNALTTIVLLSHSPSPLHPNILFPQMCFHLLLLQLLLTLLLLIPLLFPPHTFPPPLPSPCPASYPSPVTFQACDSYSPSPPQSQCAAPPPCPTPEHCCRA